MERAHGELHSTEKEVDGGGPRVPEGKRVGRGRTGLGRQLKCRGFSGVAGLRLEMMCVYLVYSRLRDTAETNGIDECGSGSDSLPTLQLWVAYPSSRYSSPIPTPFRFTNSHQHLFCPLPPLPKKIYRLYFFFTPPLLLGEKVYYELKTSSVETPFQISPAFHSSAMSHG